MGGEEFAIILPNTNMKGAQRVCDSIREKIATLGMRPNLVTKNTLTVSIGLVCQLANDVNEPEDLILAADRALYKAKRNGRDRVVIAPQIK